VKRILISLAVLTTLLIGFAAPASAQGDQSITADPSNVAEAGEHEINVTGSGYTGPAFLLPCPGAEGDLTKVAEDGACDLGALTPVTPDDDGNFEASATFEIPEQGLVMVVGNAAQTEVAVALVTVGGEAEAEAEAEEEAAPAVASDDSGDDALAETGIEAYQLVIIGAAVAMAGAMVSRTRREMLIG